MREREIEQYFRLAMEARGGEAWKFVSPGRRGVPDRLVLLPGGKYFFAEIKRPGGKVEPHQARIHRRIVELGSTVHVVDSIDYVDWMTRFMLPKGEA
jgi:hypothetical protein